MRTITKNIYLYSELSREAQLRALEELWDVTIDYPWWSFIHDDAAAVGLQIHNFDRERHTIEGKLTRDMNECIALIYKQHGETRETYKVAADYDRHRQEIVERHSDGVDIDRVAVGNEEVFALEADLLESAFLKQLLQCYLTTLEDEYEHLTTEEAIIDTIDANEYEFYENGTLYH